MKRVAVINLVVLILLNVIYLVYLFIIDTDTANTKFFELLANSVFIVGFLGGLLSLGLLVISVRNKYFHPILPVLGIIFALLLIPELFLISLEHYFERCDFPNYC